MFTFDGTGKVRGHKGPLPVKKRKREREKGKVRRRVGGESRNQDALARVEGSSSRLQARIQIEVFDIQYKLL